jgi:hypothetical protein
MMERARSKTPRSQRGWQAESRDNPHSQARPSNTVPSCEGVLPHQEDIAARTLKPPGVLTTAERQDRQEKKSAHELSGHRP